MSFIEGCAMIIASLGGIASTVILIVKFGGNKLAELLSAKYQLKLDKELETQKSVLQRKNYVSKARFDKEFEVYQRLVSFVYKPTFLTWNVYNALSKPKELFKEKSEKFLEIQRAFITSFYNDSVLISKEFANKFEILVKSSAKFEDNMRYFRERYERYESILDLDGDINVYPREYYNEHCIPALERMTDIHDEINRAYGELVDEIREYLNSLEAY